MRATTLSGTSAGNVTLLDSKLQGKPEKLRLSEFYSRNDGTTSSHSRQVSISPSPESKSRPGSPTFYGIKSKVSDE